MDWREFQVEVVSFREKSLIPGRHYGLSAPVMMRSLVYVQLGSEKALKL
jgi:hypothetical protein